MLRIDLPDRVTDELYEQFAAIAPLPSQTDQLLARLLGAFAVLPVSVREQLLSFRASPYAPAAALLSGLPIDKDLPPTPVEGAGHPGKGGSVSECAILTVALLLGEPVAYRAEKAGALVQNVFPTQSQRSTPSKREF